MIEWLKVILLGIVEGVTEFLPISSTGHLIVAAALLDFQNSMGGTFEIFIQLGAVVAVVLFYRRQLVQQARTLPSSRDVQRFWLAIVVASIPAALFGFLLRHWIKAVLFSPGVVAISLIVGGLIFLLVERGRREDAARTTESTQISLRQAIIVGLAQTTALIPGVSRSGASIIGGMGAGLSRRAATEFSFYLAIPVLGCPIGQGVRIEHLFPAPPVDSKRKLCEGSYLEATPFAHGRLERFDECLHIFEGSVRRELDRRTSLGLVRH